MSESDTKKSTNQQLLERSQSYEKRKSFTCINVCCKITFLNLKDWIIRGSYELNRSVYSRTIIISSTRPPSVFSVRVCIKINGQLLYAVGTHQALIRYRAIMIYKILNGQCPESLNGKLITRSQISKYQTRNQQDLDIPRLNLEFSKTNFFYTSAKTWNEIPLQIRLSSNVFTFRKRLKEFLQN